MLDSTCSSSLDELNAAVDIAGAALTPSLACGFCSPTAPCTAPGTGAARSGAPTLPALGEGHVGHAGQDAQVGHAGF